MSSPFPPGPNGPQQQPNQGGWNQQQPQGQPQGQQPGWGQQPPQGQQPGGYPPPAGGSPPAGCGGFPPGGGQPGFYGGPPPPPPRSNKVKKIVLPIVGLVVVLGIGLGVKAFSSKDDAASAKVGDCLETINGGIGNKKLPKITECTDAGAKWKVIAKFNNSTDTDKCDALPKDQGYFGSFYWTGSKKGLVCLSFTSKTVLQDVKNLDPISAMGFGEKEFAAVKKDYVTQGVKFE